MQRKPQLFRCIFFSKSTHFVFGTIIEYVNLESQKPSFLKEKKRIFYLKFKNMKKFYFLLAAFIAIQFNAQQAGKAGELLKNEVSKSEINTQKNDSFNRNNPNNNNDSFRGNLILVATSNIRKKKS
jgi:hypothetical protein